MFIEQRETTSVHSKRPGLDCIAGVLYFQARRGGFLLNVIRLQILTISNGGRGKSGLELGMLPQAPENCAIETQARTLVTSFSRKGIAHPHICMHAFENLSAACDMFLGCCCRFHCRCIFSAPALLTGVKI